MADIGYRTINLEKIDEFWCYDIRVPFYGSIKNWFADIKKLANKVLYDFDEIIEIFKDILTESDPEKLAKACDDLTEYIAYGGRFTIGSDDIEVVDDFLNDLEAYKKRKTLLERHNILDKLETLIKTISEACVDVLVPYLDSKKYSKKNL